MATMQQASLGPPFKETPEASVKSERRDASPVHLKVQIKQENCADEDDVTPKPKLEVCREFRQLQTPADDVKPPKYAGIEIPYNNNSSYPGGGYRHPGAFPSFGAFSPFYGLPQTPPSFSPDRGSVGTKEPVTFRPNNNTHETYHRHEAARFEAEALQQRQQQQQIHEKPGGGYNPGGGFHHATNAYAGFRAPIQQQQQQQRSAAAYLEQRNNSYGRPTPAYSGGSKHQQQQQRKWSNNALRALHPPAPVRLFYICFVFVQVSFL